MEFEFSISDPVLRGDAPPEAAYEEFCKTNRVILLEGPGRNPRTAATGTGISARRRTSVSAEHTDHRKPKDRRREKKKPMQIDLRTVSIAAATHLRQHRPPHWRRQAGIPLPGRHPGHAAGSTHYRPTWGPRPPDLRPCPHRHQDGRLVQLQGSAPVPTTAPGHRPAKQQDTAEANFDFVENRGLAANLLAEIRDTVLKMLIPLRHVAWGSNMNNAGICAYGYGTAFTQPCIYQSMDQAGHRPVHHPRAGCCWAMDVPTPPRRRGWKTTPRQGLRRYVEDTMVIKDPFETFRGPERGAGRPAVSRWSSKPSSTTCSSKGGTPVAMLTQFMTDWYAEVRKWDRRDDEDRRSRIPENKEILGRWTTAWRDRAAAALVPVARIALAERGTDGRRPRSSSNSMPAWPRPACPSEDHLMSTVFIALQTNEETRPIVEAIIQDNLTAR